MYRIDLSADELSAKLLSIAAAGGSVAMLDSCGVGHLGSHLLIAGLEEHFSESISDQDPERSLRRFEELTGKGLSAIFTLSYSLGEKLCGIAPSVSSEPDIFVRLFRNLIMHDYDTGETWITGEAGNCAAIEETLLKTVPLLPPEIISSPQVVSNFSREDYVSAVKVIQQHIRRGDTYQTNLTRGISFELPYGTTPEHIFARLRRDHPAPFAAFIKRPDSSVISASPERFFRIEDRDISVSPIKGTRARGNSPDSDAKLRQELERSEKDRAENIMIVDLMRNDLGRVCEFGSVRAESICVVEEHPTLFHMVSTVKGRLRPEAGIADTLRAVFPCGSITGAPKISTMRIIRELEPAPRGLSMGAIGSFQPESGIFDVSVAIRTMTVRAGFAAFNVGGGIVIDSDPETEYDETVTKSRALLAASGA